jgi:hypothetical protein
MSTEPERDELQRTRDLFAFLQGEIPKGCSYKRKHQPKLTADQAWTVIWWLGNEYWQVKDYIEGCCVCGDLYDTQREGDCLDYGKAPYHFCESCRDGDEYAKKMRRNPDKEQRKEYFSR